MEQPPPSTLRYRPDIDGLRAVAVLLVVLFHAGLEFPGGFVGVDVFFVISGYLITSLLLRDLQAGSFSIAGFYERRVRRILPASLVVTALVLALGWRWMLPSDFQWLGASAAAHVVGGANVFFWYRASDYFAGAATEMPLLHMWSLAVEEQFYLLFPVVLWACFRVPTFRRRRAMLGVLALIAVISFGVSVYEVSHAGQRAFYLLPSRAWELMLGAMVAALPLHLVGRGGREAAAWLGVIAILFASLTYSPATAFPGLAAVLPCVGAALLIWAGHVPEHVRTTSLARVLSWRPAVFVGAISYSLYLFHWPLLAFDAYRSVTPSPMGHRLMLVGLAFALAIVSWAFVEQPFRKKRLLRSRPMLFSTAAVSAVALFVCGGAIWKREGVPSRFSQEIVELDNVRRTPLHLAQLTANDVKAERLTPMGDANQPGEPTVLLWGDSHAGALYPAFNAFYKSRGIKGVAATHSGTAPLVDYAAEADVDSRQATIAYNHAVIDFIAAKRIRTVFLVNYWHRNIEMDGAALVGEMKRTIDAIRKTGATIYVVMDVPSYVIEVPRAMAFEKLAGRPLPGWRLTAEGHRQRLRLMYEIAEQFEAADCHFIDPTSFFAGRGDTRFAVSASGRPFYKDGHHLTPFGARRVIVPFLESALK